jgi:serine/threonine-protein kinase HipA
LKKLFGSLKVEPYLDFDKAEFASRISFENTKRMSISGVQQKLSVRIQDNKIIPTDVGGEYILKPTPNEYPEASENEHLSMLLGQALGFDTPPFGLVNLKGGEKAYIIKRFDKENDKRLHCEDMTQIMSLNKDSHQEYKYGKSYEEVGYAILRSTGGNKACLLDFLMRMIFNFMINNGDFHLKNISLQVQAPKKELVFDRLTPNYDSLNTRLYFPNEAIFALDLFAEGYFTEKYEVLGYYTAEDFEELAGKFEIPKVLIQKFINKLHKQKNKLIELIEASFLSDEKKALYKSHIGERLKNLTT